MRLTCQHDVQLALSDANYPSIVSEDPDDQCDAEIAIASKGEDSVQVQICDYPVRDGGFHVVVNRWSEKHQTIYSSRGIRFSDNMLLLVREAIEAMNTEA